MKSGAKESQVRALRERKVETVTAPESGASNEESVMRSEDRKTKATAKARAAVKGQTAKSPAKGSKLEKIAKLLQRQDGCTSAEVLKATGWPAVSMPQQAKMLGVKLKTEKGPFGPSGRTVTRYRTG